MTFSTNELLFKFVHDAVVADGGDGSALIAFKFQDYKEMAKDFVNMFPTFKLEEDLYYSTAVFHYEYIIFTDQKNFDMFPSGDHRILTY